MQYLGHLDYVLVYIDDVIVLRRKDETEEDHLRKIEVVLSILEEWGFLANLQKCFFMMEEIDYLGYHLTKDGIKPQPKKIKALQRILPLKSAKEVKRFLGMINFYQDLLPRRLHMLAPLTKLSAVTKKA